MPVHLFRKMGEEIALRQKVKYTVSVKIIKEISRREQNLRAIY